MNIVLVGGGKAAVTIIDYFQRFSGHAITGIADLKDTAPGMARAREMGIPTTTDMKALIGGRSVDLVIELTGVEKVREMVAATLRPGQHMIDAQGARLMCELMAAEGERNAAIAAQLSLRFTELTKRLEKAMGSVDSSRETIQRLVREGTMVSINATIEAARAGEHGNAFALVVERIHDMVSSIERAVEGIAEQGLLASFGQRGTFCEEARN